MVQAFVTIIKDTRRVILPIWCIHSHSQWSFLNRTLNFTTAWKSSHTFYAVFSSIKPASLRGSHIRIFGSLGLPMIQNMLKSFTSKSTITTWVPPIIGAVHKLLLAQVEASGGILVIFNLIRLMCSSGSKSPARPTSTLILDRSYNATCIPVDILHKSSIHLFFFKELVWGRCFLP